MKKETRAGSAGKRRVPGIFREYLADQPKEIRSSLEKLIETIRAVVPEAEEGTSYGIPAFRYRDRPLASFAAHKTHMSYYPMSGAVVDAHKAELSGFTTSKGAVQFTVDREIPATLLRKLVKARLKEIELLG